MTHPTSTPLRWNWPHLAVLAGLPPFAWLCSIATLSAGAMLTLGTLLSLAWLMWAERRWPARPGWTPGAGDLARDGAFLGLNALTDAVGSLLLAWLALWIAAAVPGVAADWSPWVAVPAAVALGELGPYALHRWAHRGAWGWRVHALHHTPDRVNASNNLTAHPVNVLWNQFARTLPWLVLGFEPLVIAWASLFIQVQSFAVHANIAGTLGPLNRCIGTAELHRWHHSTVPGEALNFSTALPLWDQVFGTYRAPCGRGPAQVGIAGGSAVAGSAAWVRLLVAPVCRRCS